MLAAGPIQAYDDFVRQPGVRAGVAPATSSPASSGSRGLFKKFVLAYILQKLFLTDSRRAAYMLVEVQVFFSGSTSTSAPTATSRSASAVDRRGDAGEFQPAAAARNIIEFWERWHISLSLFIRRNVFIPLQMFLMRKSARARRCRRPPSRLSFVCPAGLWHGLTPGFLAWGTASGARAHHRPRLRSSCRSSG